MNKLIIICIFIVTNLNLAIAESQNNIQEKKIIKLASDNWCPFICSQKTMEPNGFLVDLVQEAMKAEGYEIKPIIMPLNRAILETNNKIIDGVYAPPIDKRLNLTNTLFKSRACFFTKINSNWHYDGITSLEKLQLAVIDDYGYDNDLMDKFLDNNRHQNKNSKIFFSTGDDAGVKNLKMLVLGRVDVYLEHENVLAYLSSTLKTQNKIRNAGCLESSLPLVVGFSLNAPNSKEYVEAINRGMIKVSKSRIQKLKETYHILN